MARRSEPSPVEQAVEVAGFLPWWLNVGLGAGSYFGMSALAEKYRHTVSLPGDEHVAIHTLRYGAAVAGKWLLPMIFVLGAITSIVNRSRRRALVRNTSGSDAAAFVAGMSWRDFERLVGQAFRNKGFTVSETGGGGADGGVDLVISRGRETILVQCKHWRSTKVGVRQVRELFGVMAARGATGGYVVTSGSFSSDALSFAKGRNIELIDGPGLVKLVSGTVMPPAAPVTAAKASTAPACPKCGTNMIRRTAKAGATPGKQFWGCSTFPKCRGTIDG